MKNVTGLRRFHLSDGLKQLAGPAALAPDLQRRRQLHSLLGFIITIIAAGALFSPFNSVNELNENVPTDISRVSYRPDGGQMADPAGNLEPNLLTSLNGGRVIKLSSANPGHLAHLPSLGFNSAVKAVQSGCLNSRQKKTLNGIITESCDQNKP